MSFTYDLVLSSNLHKVRNMINDTNSVNYQIEDEEITSFLSIFKNDLFLTASSCLKKIAASKALVSKRIAAGDYAEDAKSVVADLLRVARVYERESINTPYEADSQEILTDFNYQSIVRNKVLRDEEII
jgi:hypothetical protein